MTNEKSSPKPNPQIKKDSPVIKPKSNENFEKRSMPKYENPPPPPPKKK